MNLKERGVESILVPRSAVGEVSSEVEEPLRRRFDGVEATQREVAWVGFSVVEMFLIH